MCITWSTYKKWTVSVTKFVEKKLWTKIHIKLHNSVLICALHINDFTLYIIGDVINKTFPALALSHVVPVWFK